MESSSSYDIDASSLKYIDENNINYSGIFNQIVDNINCKEFHLSDAINGTTYINDDFIDFVDVYCQERFPQLLYPLSDVNHGLDDYTHKEKRDIIYNQRNLNLISEPPYIFVFNQPEDVISNNKSRTQILHDNINFGENNSLPTFHHDESFIKRETDILLEFQQTESEKQYLNIEEKKMVKYKNLAKSNKLSYQPNDPLKKDEGFHKKLISLINHKEINQLSGEIYSLEYYRSCNKLLAMKSRPLANLRQTNEDAERNHKALIDLNKKCRSIIRKFKNGFFTIDTIFKWNESRSKDGPMSCSICRCNKFFKRPGSIANHIYRVHERILREALERGELHRILEKNRKHSEDKTIGINDHLLSPRKKENHQSCGALQNSISLKTFCENSSFLSSCHSSLNNYDVSYQLAVQEQSLNSNVEDDELVQALKTIKKDFDKF